MLIRDARAEDLAVIVAIYNAAVPGRTATADTEPVTIESRREWFEAHTPTSRPLWVVERSGVVIGWLSLQSFYGRPAYHATAEISIYVAPAHQRRGVARQLLAAAIQRTPALGVRTLLGFIFGHNEASLHLFEFFGFERWGNLPRVAELDGTERDVVILGRRIA